MKKRRAVQKKATPEETRRLKIALALVDLKDATWDVCGASEALQRLGCDTSALWGAVHAIKEWAYLIRLGSVAKSQESP